jgi:hypothetical protein
LVAIRPPLTVVQAEGGVVVGQAAQLDLLGVAGVTGQHCPLVAQLSRGPQMDRVVERLMAGPAARMVSHRRPSDQTRTRSRSASTSTRRPTAAGWTE